MADLLVKLYDIKDCPELIYELEKKDEEILWGIVTLLVPLFFIGADVLLVLNCLGINIA